MSRSTSWRRSCSDAVSWHQDQANNTTIFILREMGPTGFLLKEENESGKFKVYLGDPHSCTCSTFKREKELCKHICWVLLRKFKMPRQNPVSWQLGLVEREINEILRGNVTVSRPGQNARRLSKKSAFLDIEDDQGKSSGELSQRPISEDDVCPICQEEFLAKRLPVTYCRFGCGNNVHIKCMKVWAEHQNSTGETNIKCPLCRENFGPLASLQQELRNTRVNDVQANIKQEHPGTVCHGCDSTPITGKCYKCTSCSEVYLCQRCFNSPSHPGHSFLFREKTTQRWRPAQRGSGPLLPNAIVESLMSRDINDNDYDLLLQLDSENNELSDLTEDTVNSLPMEQIRTSKNPLLAPGQQCRICLQRYVLNQWLRRLPCRHHFHKDCIENWLLHHQAKCPVDGMVFTNQSVRRWKDAMRKAKQQRSQTGGPSSRVSLASGSGAPGSDLIGLEIPGIGIGRVKSSGANDGNSSSTSQNLHHGLALANNIRRTHSSQSDSRLQPERHVELGICGRQTSQSSASNESVQSVPTTPQEPSSNRNYSVPISLRHPTCSIPSSKSRFEGLIVESGLAEGLPPHVPNPGRTGRLRKKKLHNSMRAPRDVITRVLNQDDATLFVGSDIEHSTGQMIQTTSISQPQSRQNKHRPSNDNTSDSPFRWGDTRLLSGSDNDIVLAGNTVRNSSFQDQQ